MNIILHYPEEGRTETERDVESFEIEWGSKNTVKIWYTDGSFDDPTATGLTVSGATE